MVGGKERVCCCSGDECNGINVTALLGYQPEHLPENQLQKCYSTLGPLKLSDPLPEKTRLCALPSHACSTIVNLEEGLIYRMCNTFNCSVRILFRVALPVCNPAVTSRAYEYVHCKAKWIKFADRWDPDSLWPPMQGAAWPTVGVLLLLRERLQRPRSHYCLWASSIGTHANHRSNNRGSKYYTHGEIERYMSIG